MRLIRKRKNGGLGRSQLRSQSSNAASRTTAGVSVCSKSLLSGSFPSENGQHDDGTDGHNSNNSVETIPQSGRAQQHPQTPFEFLPDTEPPLQKMIASHDDRSSLSIDATEEEEEKEDEDGIDVLEFAEHLNQLWKTDPQQAILQNSTSNQLLDMEDCSLQYKKMIADRQQLERILIARKHELPASASLFFEQVRFRARWKPQEIRPKDIPNALPSGAWRLCGYTKEGCVVSNYKLQYWDPNAYSGSSSGENDKKSFDEGVNEYVRYVCYMLELMIANMKPEPAPQKFCLIFDLKGFTPSLVFRRNVRAMIVKLIYVAQSQYPERLRKVMLVNSPMGFASAWKLIKSLLDEKTADKVGFYAKLDRLQEDMEASVLPTEYGGTRDEYPVPS